MRRKDKKDPLAKYLNKKVRIVLWSGEKAEGIFVDWDRYKITIQYPLPMDMYWKLLDIERKYISQIIIIDDRKENKISSLG